jgi:hypothetical protein
MPVVRQQRNQEWGRSPPHTTDRPSFSLLTAYFSLHIKEDAHMRIAQLAPLIERVPPQLYGGTERVVSALTEELVRRGHEVTLFASGDSLTEAHLVPITP